ncbi:hypothetical protein EDD16DRAFT_1551795 [Pisolithus croceorrhizus]|nr:hypothetical protein EDD16DRAFT_1551795 [Pisolithus croceorrhizus]KAI6162738.1 hypothetical protein EDD17DRAFT_1574867 [Pisolithus thermaeus]
MTRRRLTHRVILVVFVHPLRAGSHTKVAVIVRTSAVTCPSSLKTCSLSSLRGRWTLRRVMLSGLTTITGQK